MTTLTIEMEVDYPKLYRFGYSSVNDTETVENWQIGNNRFTHVTNGRKYLFAVHLRDKFAPMIVNDILVKCHCGLIIYSVTKTLKANCELRINSITKTLRIVEQAESDWSSGETTEQNDGPEADWSSGETTGCSLKINTITKTLH